MSNRTPLCRELALWIGLAAPLIGLVVLPTGCSSENPPPSADKPLAPAENDSAYDIGGIRDWALIGNDLTPGHDSFELRVRATTGTDYIDVWLDEQPGVRLEGGSNNIFGLDIDVSALPPGQHRILLAADGSDEAFAAVDFQRSHPLYVVVTTDWDDADNTQLSLDLQQELHDLHPELLLTHFVGPYTFTDPTITPERVDELVAWTVNMRDTYGDEIGLHIHPYCNFVDTTSVTCLFEPSTVWASDTTGYTVMVSAYTEQEFTTLLLAADALFEQHGLGKPTSFRAGGWTADITTMRALAAAGYVADTSANNWARMEEWEGVQNGVLYEWNKSNWASIGDTSQPYYPSELDAQVPAIGGPMVPVLQVPDNGILVDYVTADEMIEIFDANWSGGALEVPTAYSIGYHPSNFSELYKTRISDALTHADRFLASADAGPVVYTTLSDTVRVWTKPE